MGVEPKKLASKIQTSTGSLERIVG